MAKNDDVGRLFFDFTVTQEDINNGISGDHERCPIALAMQRRYPDIAESIFVNERSVRVNGRRVRLSSAATEFVEAFDEGKPVAPRRFRFGHR